MGYMGFGMRKEVYERRAKRVFENWKKPKLNKSQHTFHGRSGHRVESNAIRITIKIFLIVLMLTLVVVLVKYFSKEV